MTFGGIVVEVRTRMTIIFIEVVGLDVRSIIVLVVNVPVREPLFLLCKQGVDRGRIPFRHKPIKASL